MCFDSIFLDWGKGIDYLKDLVKVIVCVFVIHMDVAKHRDAKNVCIMVLIKGETTIECSNLTHI